MSKTQEEFGIDVVTTQRTEATDTSAKKEKPARPKKGFVVARTAFWASLTATLLCIAITFTVKALSGILSTDLVILSGGGVLATLLLAMRNRWTSLVATVMNAYFFYLIWTEPFVTSSISNPKGPNGGLGHFYGDILIICASLLAFVCSLGATVQYFQGTSRQTPRWYPVFIGIIVGIVLGAMHVGDVALPYSATTGLSVANGVATLHVDANNFLQSSVTLSKGNKLVLVSDSTEKHELYNGIWQNGSPEIQQEQGAPLVNDMILNGKSVTIGPFTTAGTYHIFCTLHKGMELTIIVQ